MNRTLTKRFLPLLALLSAAAIFAAQAPAPDRSAPPALGPTPVLRVPPVTKRALSNGLPVWIVETREVPVVAVSAVIKAGSGADPSGQFGLGSLTAAMLDEGAGSRSALESADAADYLGASLATFHGVGQVHAASLGPGSFAACVAFAPVADPCYTRAP
jgi:hypothetical protein